MWNVTSAENKPQDGVEVLGFNKTWIHPDFNKDGTRLCFLNDETTWCMGVWNASFDTWQAYYDDDQYNIDSIYKPTEEELLPPTHWMYKPTPPWQINNR